MQTQKNHLKIAFTPVFNDQNMLLPLSCKCCKGCEAQNSFQVTSNWDVQTPQDGNVKNWDSISLSEISGKMVVLMVNLNYKNDINVFMEFVL